MNRASHTTIPCSVLILAKDAAATLENTLASLQGFAHIIVGDDSSTDATIAVAKKMGADVIKLRRVESFAAKRNELTAYAPDEWVLWVDADEIVTEALRDAVAAVVTAKSSTVDGHQVLRSDIFSGRLLRYGETAHTWLVRLGKKSAGTWDRDVHEIWKFRGHLGRLQGVLLHHPHESVSSFFAKIARYSWLEAQWRWDTHHQGRTALHTWLYLTRLLLQLCVYPGAKFMHNYIIRLGFLDGLAGFVYAYMMSLHSLCVRIHLVDMVRREKTL